MKQDFSNLHEWKLFAYLCKLQVMKILKHPGFALLTLISLSFLNSNFIGNASNAQIQPTTAYFLQQLAISEFPIILITLFFVGETVWRERHLKASALLDAYPVKNWVLFSAKIVAIFAVQLIYALIIILFGILVQLFFFEFYEIQLFLYLKMILGVHLIYYWIITVGFFFLQVISPNKYIGFVISAVCLIFIIILPSLGVDGKLFSYGVIPEYRFSALNGLGPFSQIITWYSIYWVLLAVFLFMISFLMWPRGKEKNSLSSLLNELKHSSVLYKVTAFSFLVLFIICGIYITLQRPQGVSNDDIALYEKKFKAYEKLTVPNISNVKLNLDIFPDQKRLVMKGQYQLENNSERPIDTLLISLLPKTSFTFNREITLIEYDQSALGTRIYRLNQPLEPNESILVSFDYEIGRKGFDALSPNIDLIKNGILLSNIRFYGFQYFPKIGYDIYTELQDSILRRDSGLPGESRSLEEISPQIRKTEANRDFISYEATISTAIDQTIITNGRLEKHWQEKDRSYFHYKSDTLITDEIAIISGRYEKQTETINGTHLSIYYHPEHDENISDMMYGMIAALKFGSENQLKYPHSTLTVVEIPNYHRKLGNAFALSTLTLWNEDGGFLSSQEVKNDDHSKVFSTAVHETSHQWWPHIVQPAKAVEGGMLLNETLAQYVRLLGISREYGQGAKNNYLLRERSQYFYQRNSNNTEKSLLKTDQIFVAYNKGSLVMNSIAELIGKESLNEGLTNYFKKFAYSDSIFPVSTDLEKYILEQSPDSLKLLISDFLRSTDVYDMGIDTVSVNKISENQYDIHLQIFGKRISKGSGFEQNEEPFRGYVNVAFFDDKMKLISSENTKVENGKLSKSFIIESAPSTIKIDRNMIYLDNNLENNIRNFQKP